MKKFCHILLSMSICLALLSCSTTRKEKTAAMKGTPAKDRPPAIIFLHGVGGPKPDAHFMKNLNDFFEECSSDHNIKRFKGNVHTWDSIEFSLLSPPTAAKQWKTANRNAAAESKKLAKEIEEMEKAGRKYYLIAHSLGCKVILQALESQKQKLKHCRGVFFLGAAVPKAYKPSKNNLPDGMRIVNFYSPGWDSVLEIIFTTAEGVNAGGHLGFDDQTYFDNRRSSCTHAYKGGVADWSQLATAIGYLIYRNEGIYIPGETNVNWRLRVMPGHQLWTDIIWFPKVRIEGVDRMMVIQQNKLTKHFRAVSMDKVDGKRYREAWGSNLHAILKEFGLLEKKTRQTP